MNSNAALRPNHVGSQPNERTAVHPWDALDRAPRRRGSSLLNVIRFEFGIVALAFAAANLEDSAADTNAA